MRRVSHSDFDAVESFIDTQYFGITSAKIRLKKTCSSAHQQAELLAFMRAFEFNTITNQMNDPINNHWLGENTTAFLTDVNIQFTKNVPFSNVMDKSTFVMDNYPGDDQVVQIAERSFAVSRFLNDPYLPSGPAQYIYADITKNAFGKAGRFFVIHQTQNLINGFLLFSASGSSATIELIATRQDLKGRGIGKSLLYSMEEYIRREGVESLNVGAQLVNAVALKFYMSHGFRIKEFNSIYHYWPSKASHLIGFCGT